MPVDELQTVKYRIVPGFPDYRAGNDGTVWSKGPNTRNAIEVDGWHELKGGTDKDGYRKIILCNAGKRKYMRISAVVLKTFKGPPPKNMRNPTAAHQNGVRLDNRLSNLKWASQKDNISDKAKHGTAQVGEKHPQCRLTEKKIKAMKDMRAKTGKTWQKIADAFGEKLVTVYAACVGNNWKHIR